MQWWQWVFQVRGGTIGYKAEHAYRRGALLQKRRQLLHDWAAFLEYSQSRPQHVVRSSIGASYFGSEESAINHISYLRHTFGITALLETS
jgi:hypothetical protein